MIFEAVVISDIHLGSNLCHADDLLDFLHKIKHKEIKTNLLILNGDVFDSHDFRRLKKSHWKILSLIRKLSNEIRVVWVVGNHDGPAEFLSHILGLEAVDELILKSSNSNILITHGDKFDEIMCKYPMISKLADLSYRFMSRWFPKFFCRIIKKSSKTYTRSINIVKQRAITEAKKRGFSIVLCGHTHHPEISTINNVCYANSGSWTESPTYLTIKDGEIQLLPA